LPVTPYFVERVIEKEKPDGILLSFGGQTALNCGVEMYRNNIFEKYGVKVLGTPVQSIINTEDRQIFADILRSINIKTPVSIAVNSLEDAVSASEKIGFPIIIRAAYTLGGQGSGFCNNIEELKELVINAFSYSDQILVEESLKGWKEIEYEVVRDKYDNCITVCNMENFDPLGVHTGESIVVAPSQTLTNSEYHKLRKISIEIIRNIGVVGECNVQYALDPNSEDYRVIEVNARLSRSSALASKATGYPLAFVAAKLALGYGLHELKNSITKTTTAFFEPALDYVVVKIPRWDLNKFVGSSKEIGSSMKSVGEIMSIGKTFEEAIQKGLRMINQGTHGFVGNSDIEFDNVDESLSNPTDRRILAITTAFDKGYDVDKIHDLTKIDKWFLYKLKSIYDIHLELKKYDKVEDCPKDFIKELKMKGFSDFQLARFINKSTENMHEQMLKIREYRKSVGIVPFIKQIDTLSAEYPASTNYLYVTYNASESDIQPDNQKSVIVLGSGTYRIGSSVEFDWCSVNAVNTIRKENIKSIMINHNPETVSTDYDICDKLYFDELSFERVTDIIESENPLGVIVSMGGQVPNNLSLKLHNFGVKVLGTSPIDIDRAEDRNKFSSLLDELDIDQPRWKELTNIKEVDEFIEEVGYPVLIRPSYVLSGAAMNVVSNKSELDHFLEVASKFSKDHPIVISEFIQNAKEIEIDAVADKGEIVLYAISEHVEFAGVHSGDATIVFPAQKIYIETIRRIKKITRDIAKKLNISGPFNMQLLAKDNDIKVIECNLRASRSFPFVSKVSKINFIELATKVIIDSKYEVPSKSLFDIDYVGVKASQFSFSRLQNVDPVLGVEMASTGEVGCIDENYYDALLKSMLSVGYKIPNKNILLSTGNFKNKVDLLESVRLLSENGYNLFATPGTSIFLSNNGIECTTLDWPDSDNHPTTVHYMRDKKIDMVINIPKNLSNTELNNDFEIRRCAIDFNIPLITDAQLADDFIKSFCGRDINNLKIKSWDEY
jgi:carbamoyl-phosphate synthase large subunit